MRKRRQVLLELVRRADGRHKMNFVEIEKPIGSAGHREMATVNGIEGSAKERDAARMMFCGGALRVRCRQYASRETLTVFSHKSLKGTGALPDGVSAFSCEAGPKSSKVSAGAFGILSNASAMERTSSRTPSPVAAEMA